jgi:hypothetical protein
MKRYVIISLIFGLGVALLALGAPRLIAAVVMFPGEPILQKVQNLEPVDEEELKILIVSQQRGLSWIASGRKWMDLGLAQLLLAEKKDANDPERLNLISSAIKSLRTGLAMAPASPFAWTRLAHAEILKGGASPEALGAFRFGLETAPFEPRLAIARLTLGVSLWDELQEVEKQLIFKQMRSTWKSTWKDKTRLTDFALETGRPNLIRAALLKSPKDLAYFEKMLKWRAKKPS